MLKFEQILSKEETISIVGLGYVGMPIAVAFAKKANVIGFDISESKVDLYKNGIDPTREVGDDVIKNTTVEFTANPADLRRARFHIVAVPTPITKEHIPNLFPLESASRTVGENLVKGSIVVFESTVYPGVTEEICIPILEEASGLICGVDFKVGYSPERINPGDKVHTLENIIKVVSGMDEETLETVAKVYEMVVDAGVYRAASIKVAEAAKVIENSQRDINIAFMNELSMIFDRLDINTREVLEAAGTKWNFLNFTPGLVGGHCIGVDPYYLTFKAEQTGYHSQIILSGRKINDNMGKYVAENTIKNMIQAGINIKESKVAIMGFTFKENCPDTRNTRVIDIVEELNTYGINPLIVDPQGDEEEAIREYNIQFTDISNIKDVDAIIFAVNHREFVSLTKDEIDQMYSDKNDSKVLIDVKSMYDQDDYAQDGYRYWSL